MRNRAEHVYHQFVIRTQARDDFKAYLERCGIQVGIHYPIPPHLAECYQWLGHIEGDYSVTETYAKEVLSLPIFNGMTNEEINYVIEVCNDYRK